MQQLNGIVCTALTVVGVWVASGALARDAARVKGTDGVWTEVPLVGVREADGGNIACKFPDGTVQRCHDAFAGGRAYRLCLKNAWETFLPGELERIAALGFRGAHYIDVFTAVFPYSCWDPRHRANRKEIAAYQRKVVERCIELFGGFSSECDMDHLIGLVDYANYNTREIKNAQLARARVSH